MGFIFKKTVTCPLPAGADFFVPRGVRYARWRDSRGKNHTAPVTTGRGDVPRIKEETSRYYARYRDGSGIVVEVPTGCRDEGGLRWQVHAGLGAEGRANPRWPDHFPNESRTATPIGQHVEDFARLAGKWPARCRSTSRSHAASWARSPTASFGRWLT